MDAALLTVLENTEDTEGVTTEPLASIIAVILSLSELTLSFFIVAAACCFNALIHVDTLGSLPEAYALLATDDVSNYTGLAGVPGSYSVLNTILAVQEYS